MSDVVRTTAAVPAVRTRLIITNPFSIRSDTMHSLHEALAREHQRELEQRAREARLAKQCRSERRYHRPALQRRHAHR